MTDIRHLRHFDAVYKLRSFVAAAKEQSVTQSALTKSIKTLEAKLGERLFDRTTHSVSPTEFGDRLILHARDVIGSLRVFEQQSQHLAGLRSGSVNVGSGPYPLQELLTSTIQAFSEDHNAIQINVHTGGPNALMTRLINRELDMVISDISKFETMSFFEQIEIEPLPVEPLVVVHRKDHPISQQSMGPDVLATYPWALPRSSPHFERLTKAVAARNNPASRPFPQYVVEVPSVCIELARSTDVLTSVPQSYAQTLCDRDSCLGWTALPKAFQTHDGIHTLRGKTPSPAARRFLECVKGEAGKRQR